MITKFFDNVPYYLTFLEGDKDFSSHAVFWKSDDGDVRLLTDEDYEDAFPVQSAGGK